MSRPTRVWNPYPYDLPGHICQCTRGPRVLVDVTCASAIRKPELSTTKGEDGSLAGHVPPTQSVVGKDTLWWGSGPSSVGSSHNVGSTFLGRSMDLVLTPTLNGDDLTGGLRGPVVGVTRRWWYRTGFSVSRILRPEWVTMDRAA